MNFNAVGDRVADLRTGPVGGLDNLQTRWFEHRDIQRQRREVVEVNVLAHQIESAGDRQRLVVQRVHSQGKQAGLGWTQTKLNHSRDVTLGRDAQEIVGRVRRAADFVVSERKAEMTLAVRTE